MKVPTKEEKYPQSHVYGHKRPYGKRLLNKKGRKQSKARIRKDEE